MPRRDDEISEQARRWIVRLASGGMTDDELVAFEAWLGRSDAHARAFDDERTFWRRLSAMEDVFERLESAAGTPPDQPVSPVHRSPLRRWRAAAICVAAAACLLLLLVAPELATGPASPSSASKTAPPPPRWPSAPSSPPPRPDRSDSAINIRSSLLPDAPCLRNSASELHPRSHSGGARSRRANGADFRHVLARRRRRIRGVIFWRNMRPADLATLLAAIASNARKPASSPLPADRFATMADRRPVPSKRPLTSGGGMGD